MRRVCVLLFVVLLSSCRSSSTQDLTSPAPEPPAGSGAIIGGDLGNNKTRSKEEDQMILRQQKEIERQRRELEDIKRQKLYDDRYRRYKSEH